MLRINTCNNCTVAFNGSLAIEFQSGVVFRGVPIIGPADISSADMLIFAISIIGITYVSEEANILQIIVHAKFNVI